MCSNTPNKHGQILDGCNACLKKKKKNLIHNICRQTHRSFGRCLCLLTGNCWQARSSRTPRGWWRDWAEHACRLRRSWRPDSLAGAGTYNCPDDMILKTHTHTHIKVRQSVVSLQCWYEFIKGSLVLRLSYEHPAAHSNHDTNSLSYQKENVQACMFRSVNFVGDHSGPAPY